MLNTKLSGAAITYVIAKKPNVLKCVNPITRRQLLPFVICCFIKLHLNNYQRILCWRNNTFLACIHIGHTCMYMLCCILILPSRFLIQLVLCIVHVRVISHARTVEQECSNGDDASQWKCPEWQNSIHCHAKTAWPILTKTGISDNVVDITWHSKLYRAPFGGFWSRVRDFSYYRGWLVCGGFLGSCNCLQPTTLNGFLRQIRQKTSFRPRMYLLGVRWRYFIFIPLNFWKTAPLEIDFDWTLIFWR